MRGQRLFVRPIDPADHEAVRAFLGYVPPCGLLGKLVGNLVAVLAMEITDEGLRIDDLVVARDLRRKRIGRFMLDEAGAVAAKLDRDRLIVEGDRLVAERSDAGEFLLRVGFYPEGERFVRRVR